MNRNWSTEEYRHFIATGERPTDSAPRPVTELGKRVNAGRHHRIIPTRADGLKFDSLTEARRYDYLRFTPEVAHVDIHPTLTLACGVRYRVDFIAWWKTAAGPLIPVAEDVKGSEKLARTTEMKRLMMLVRQHPIRELHMVWWNRPEQRWMELE